MDNESYVWPTLSVCQVLSSPLAFNGKLIRLTGLVVETDEGAFVSGENDCPRIVRTGNHVWPTLIAITSPSSSARLHNPAFGYDKDSERVPFAKYRELKKHFSDKCLVWTFSGMFETREDWANAQAHYPNGSSKYLGFGNQNLAPGQLLRHGVVDVEVSPRCVGQR